MGTITLDIAPYGHECECCQNANYRRPGFTEPEYPCAIYALTIGAGYRQPSYLCPNCLATLRITLGPSNLAAVNFDAFKRALEAAAEKPVAALVRLFSDKAPCSTEGE